jgi:hypothetical protein
LALGKWAGFEAKLKKTKDYMGLAAAALLGKSSIRALCDLSKAKKRL